MLQHVCFVWCSKFYVHFSEKDLAISANDDLQRDIGNYGSLVAGIIALLRPENVQIINLKVKAWNSSVGGISVADRRQIGKTQKFDFLGR